MLDPKKLRESTDEVAFHLAKRGFVFDKIAYNALETQRKALQSRVEQLRAQRNQHAKSIGQAKARHEDVSHLMAIGESLSRDLNGLTNELQEIQEAITDFCANIPNIPHVSVPEGMTEAQNQEIRSYGEKPSFNFTPKDHVTLAQQWQWFDIEAATKIAGARFVVLQGIVARLHRALVQFMLDVHTQQHGYLELNVPYLVNEQSLYGTGQLPKFREDQFAIGDDSDLVLIPTAEVPVTNMVRDRILAETELPLRWVAHTPCFRREAGTYGKDTRGIIRLHQFEKVELVQIVHPEQSYDALDKLTHHAEIILQQLGLPYRVVALSCGDLGFSAAKTFDLEVWLPGQQAYREISSCTNFEDFQARRMQARYKASHAKKPTLVHTINGSGLAVGRTLVALLENGQDEAGRVHIPPVLQPYMQGMTVIPACD